MSKIFITDLCELVTAYAYFFKVMRKLHTSISGVYFVCKQLAVYYTEYNQITISDMTSKYLSLIAKVR